MKYENLSQLIIGEKAKIKKVNCNNHLQRRLNDLGLIDGTVVECVHISPYGSPMAFNIRGAVIALRKDNCKEIDIFNDYSENF